MMDESRRPSARAGAVPGSSAASFFAVAGREGGSRRAGARGRANPVAAAVVGVSLAVVAGIIGEPAPAAAQQSPPPLEAIQQLLDEGRAGEALTQLDRRIARDGNDLPARFLKGLVLMEQGDNAGARAIYLDIARQFPQLPEAFNNLAAVYVSEGEYEKARQALVSARANAPDYPLVHGNLGDLYLQMAVEAYREAVRLDGADSVSARKLRALQALQSGP